jgi:hypothetical protein
MNLPNLTSLVVPSWVKPLGYVMIALAVIAPYIALYFYIPAHTKTKAELLALEVRVARLVEVNDTLNKGVTKCNQAADTMRTARDTADKLRRAAESKSLAAAVLHDTRIATMKAKLKEPTHATEECTDLKDFIDVYTVPSSSGLRNNPATGTGDNQRPDSSKLR